MPSPTPLLRCVVEAAVRAVAAGIPAASLPYVLPVISQEVWERWGRERGEEQRRSEVGEVARAAGADVHREVQALAAELATGLPAEAREPLTASLLRVVDALRQSRPSEAPLRSGEDLLRLLQGDVRLVEASRTGGPGPVPSPEKAPAPPRGDTPAEGGGRGETPARSRRTRGAGVWDLLDTLQKDEPELSKLVVNSAGMKLALIPAGTFQMGSPETDPEPRHCEVPRHEVAITRAYYLAVTPVTQEQYEAVMGGNPSWFTREQGGGPDHPVEKVSWEEAAAFCRKLSARPDERSAGRTYRLPTEAEWEYACRAGTDTAFGYGASLSSAQANFDGGFPAGGAPKGPALGRTSKVGSYPANNFGLFDMHGNVWEWCADWFDPSYYRDSPRRDPAGPPRGQTRVLRGGCWRSHALTCRAAYRNALAATQRDRFTGFRVLLEAGGRGA